MSDRLMRLCDVCYQYDDHPRHVIGLSTPQDRPSLEELSRVPDGASPVAIAELMDLYTTVRHLDCCAANGCSSCASQLEIADNAQGADLLKSLLTNDAHTEVAS